MMLGSTGSIFAVLSDENPDLSTVEVQNKTFAENLLLPSGGAQNFSAEADEPNLVPSMPFQISKSLVQGNNSIVAAPDDTS